MNQTPGGDRICHGCFEDSCVNCYNCGCAVWQNECTYYDDNPYCRRCYSRVHRDWDTKEFHCGDPHYDDIGSKRRFGIELETSECPNHYPLRETTLWGCKPDCSIEGLEFISPPLYGDEGLQDIYNFCREANFRGWNVDSRCGYHAHFDLTGETWQALRSIAYAYRKTYTMWSRFVSDGRSENAMCGTPRYRCENIAAIKSAEDWEYFVAARDRFEFLNWRAYLVHSTLEIRTHDPTLNVVEICNWIKVHTRFIDYVARLTIDEIDFLFGSTANKNFRVLSEIVGNTLADFYRDRARNFGKPVVRETVTA